MLTCKQIRTDVNKVEIRGAERFCGRGEGILRAPRLTTILITAALTLAAPAVAQEPPTDAGEANASSQQYGVYSSESLADGIRDASDTAGRGAGDTGSSDGKVAGLTELPETGGAPLLAAGVLLVGAGLLVRRIVG